MSSRRHAATAAAVLSLAVAGPATLAVQSASAATPPPAGAPATDGLLDPIFGIVTGLGSTLNTLLSPTALTNLNGLTTSLGNGGVANVTALAPVQSLLSGLTATNGLSPDLTALLGQVTQLSQAGSGSGAIPTPFLQPVTTLLGALTGQSGLGGNQLTSLTNLKNALTALIGGALPTSSVAGLPLLSSLSLSGNSVSSLTSLLGQLQGGAKSTPALLAPVTTLLQQVATTPGLPAPVAEVLNTVATQLAGAANLTSGVVTPVGQLLNAIAATQGVSGTPVATLLGTLSGLLDSAGSDGAGGGSTGGTTPPSGGGSNTPATGGGSNAPGALTPGQTGNGQQQTTTTTNNGGGAAGVVRIPVKVKGVRFDRKRNALIYTLSCPRSGKGGCITYLFAISGTRSIVTPVIVSVGEGQVLTRTLKLDSKARNGLKKKSLKLTAYAATSRTQISTKSLKVAKTPKAKAEKKR